MSQENQAKENEAEAKANEASTSENETPKVSEPAETNSEEPEKTEDSVPESENTESPESTVTESSEPAATDEPTEQKTSAEVTVNENADNTAPSLAASDVLLEISGVNHNFGPHKVLHNVNLKVARGDIIGLVGPSGCGKSTLLRAIVGTHPPRSGKMTINGRQIEGPARDRGIVYQHYSLFPFLTAIDNVAFGPLLDQTNVIDRWLKFFSWRKLRKSHLEEAEALLRRFGLGHALHKYPHQLSGGMRQRVAIAQALIMKPELLVLDEPFGALDEATREDLQDMLVELFHENIEAKQAGKPPPYTIVIVTHELNEALYVSNRVIGLSQYWNYEAEGINDAPGATIIYDKPAPITELNAERNPEQFVEQRYEIRNSVFQPETPLRYFENRSYWQEDIDFAKEQLKALAK